VSLLLSPLLTRKVVSIELYFEHEESAMTLFLVAVLAGRLFRLSYEDNATLAFTTTARNSEAVIGVAVSAFPGHPLVYLAIILGPIVELPMLLLIARIMLGLKDRIGAAPAAKPRRV
jgi:ACR3 family arsenite efflux pump ArsB